MLNIAGSVTNGLMQSQLDGQQLLWFLSSVIEIMFFLSLTQVNKIDKINLLLSRGLFDLFTCTVTLRLSNRSFNLGNIPHFTYYCQEICSIMKFWVAVVSIKFHSINLMLTHER